MKRFDTPDIDGFCKSATIDGYCSIIVDLGDFEWSSRGFVHFWLTSALVSIKDKEDFIADVVGFVDSCFVFFSI
jgi:hypothetical protein